MKTDTIIGWIVVFFLGTSFWITVIVPQSFSREHEEETKLHLKHSPAHLAIFCLERSGSTWLTAMLNENFGVNVLAEPLHPLATKHSLKKDKLQAALEEYQLLLNKMSSSNKSARLVGFNEKLIYPKYAMPTQPSVLKNLSNYLYNNDYKILFLHRKNVVFQAVSMIRAVQLASKCGSDGWSKTHERGWKEACGKYHEELMRLPIPLADVQENIARAQKKSEEIELVLKEIKLPYLEIYYEDLHDDPKNVMLQISHLTGIHLEAKETLFVKQGDVNLRKSVPNVDELYRLMREWNPCLLDHVKYFNPTNSCRGRQ